MDNIDIVARPNPVARGGRPGRPSVKQADVIAEDAKPVRKSARGPRPTASNGILEDRTVVSEDIKKSYPDCTFYWETDDEAGRKIKARTAIGWEVCKDPLTGSIVTQAAGLGGKDPNANLVLMCLPLEWYEEDVRKQEAFNAQKMNSLRRGSTRDHINGDGTYAPRLPDGSYGLSIKQGIKD